MTENAITAICIASVVAIYFITTAICEAVVSVRGRCAAPNSRPAAAAPAATWSVSTPAPAKSQPAKPETAVAMICRLLCERPLEWHRDPATHDNNGDLTHTSGVSVLWTEGKNDDDEDTIDMWLCIDGSDLKCDDDDTYTLQAAIMRHAAARIAATVSPLDNESVQLAKRVLAGEQALAVTLAEKLIPYGQEIPEQPKPAAPPTVPEVAKAPEEPKLEKLSSSDSDVMDHLDLEVQYDPYSGEKTRAHAYGDRPR